MNNGNIEKLESIIRSNMRKTNTPGMAITILKENQVIYAKGFGARDLKEMKPMTPDTLIGIGSITKSFTALSLLILQERGKLSIEDSGSKYLQFKPFINHPEIKIKHMLSHSSGIPAADGSMSIFDSAFNNFSRIYPSITKEDFIAHIGEPEEYIIFKPGEKFFYNNDMYTCLSFIIEQVSGSTYANFIKKEIFEPLEMKRATFDKKEFLEDPDHMTGYQPKKENENSVMTQYDVPMGGFVESAGGICISMNEMMHYAEFLLNKGKYKGNTIIKEEFFEKLFTPQIQTPYGFGKTPYYCLGWTVDDYFQDKKFIGHGGGMGTSCAYFGFVPELNMAVSIAQNSCTGPISVYGRIPFVLEMGLPVEKTIKYFENKKILDVIAGNYKAPLNMYDFKIEVKGGIVTADFEIDDGKFSFPLLLVDKEELKFQICSSLAEKTGYVTFYRNKDTNKIEFLNYDRYLYKKV